MRRLLSLLAVLALTGCGAYQQIATMSPVDDSAVLTEDGYVCKEGNLTFTYNFWEENGNAGFLITNNGEKDVYLDITESTFIKNGRAFDYYPELTKSHKRSEVNKRRSLTRRIYKGTTDISAAVLYNFGNAGKASAAVTKEVGQIATVNFQETHIENASVSKQLVCIPAGTSKYFTQFAVSYDLIRLYGIDRFPYKGTSGRSFEIGESPIVIENRLCIYEDIARGNHTKHLISNKFYLSGFINIKERNAYKMYVPEPNSISLPKYYMNTYRNPASFYINYVHTRFNDIPSRSE